ncbi:MAG TPA: hypothetical protein VGQ85_03335 [Candidatus Limnocylindrales bacterium]|nr:hypothetical protein [Candidatus Limnocylindrales bacterium]
MEMPYQQAEGDPGRVLGGAAGAALLYAFAGFLVYWFATGSSTVGVGGEVSTLGAVIWLGPVVGCAALLVIGPRGPLRRLWQPLCRLAVDRDEIAWSRDGQVLRAKWDDVGGLMPRPYLRHALNFVIVGSEGHEIGRLPAEVIGPDGRHHWTADLVVETRPDLFIRAKRRLWRTVIRRPAQGTLQRPR